MVTIILAHPWHGSFNKAILDTIVAKYENNNVAYQVIDLNKDNFNPVLTEGELALYSKGQYSDPLVGEYQAALKESDEAIFIFPIWWGTAPAILKGFLDKVLLVNFSHNYENGWTPLLTIKKTSFITTSQGATENFKAGVQDSLVANLASVGFGNPVWLNCEETSYGTQEHREEFLSKVEKHV